MTANAIDRGRRETGKRSRRNPICTRDKGPLEGKERPTFKTDKRGSRSTRSPFIFSFFKKNISRPAPHLTLSNGHGPTVHRSPADPTRNGVARSLVLPTATRQPRFRSQSLASLCWERPKGPRKHAEQYTQQPEAFLEKHHPSVHWAIRPTITNLYPRASSHRPIDFPSYRRANPKTMTAC